MSRIVSFDQFKSKADKMSEKNYNTKESHNEGHEHGHEGRDHQHYMFFQNLLSIKHHIEEILNMDPNQIDELLKNGHDWACDHIATSKDDIQEVAEWARNEMEMAGGESPEHTEEEPENVIVDIEGDNEEVEVEDDEEGEEDEESEEGEEEEEDSEDEEEEEEEEEQYNEDDEYNLGEDFSDENYEE